MLHLLCQPAMPDSPSRPTPLRGAAQFWRWVAMEVLQAHPGQAGALTRISIAAKSHWGYPDELIRGWKGSLTVTSESIGSSPTFVALHEGELVGFYQLSSGPPPVRLEHLWVRPDQMGKGVGRTLLGHALNQARSTLTIDSDPHAETFYVACGARRVGQVPAPVPGQPERFLPRMELRYVGT